MRITKNVTVDGYCDFLSDNHSITATYSKVKVLGDSKPYAKLKMYYCSHQEECDLASECPLYKIAQQRTSW